MLNLSKLRLHVKPPLKNTMFSHNVILSKMVVLMGGLTLVPGMEKQPQNHLDGPPKHMSCFLVVRKS